MCQLSADTLQVLQLQLKSLATPVQLTEYWQERTFVCRGVNVTECMGYLFKRLAYLESCHLQLSHP